jgi:hypothetical protein
MKQDKQASALKKAISQLPVYQAEDRIWKKIEEELERDTEEKGRAFLKASIRQLPDYKMPESAWSELEERMLIKDPSSRKKYIRYVTGIAAGFLLLFGLLLLLEKKHGNNQSAGLLAYTTETGMTFSAEDGTKDLESSLNSMLEGHCQLEPEACKSPQFTELKNERADLDATIRELSKKYDASGNDPEIYKYLIRARKEQTEISMKLLHYFNTNETENN